MATALRLDETHDPALRSWVASANTPGHDFPIQNLPLGIFSAPGSALRLGVAIGDEILDVDAALELGLLRGDAAAAASAGQGGSLNQLMALGTGYGTALRQAVSALLGADGSAMAQAHAQHLLLSASSARMHLPAQIGGFTDFLTSIEHIRRARRTTHPDEPVPQTLLHMPLAYNGRASSIRASGHHVTRPKGQSRQADGAIRFGPAEALDFELELGAFIGPGSELGDTVPVGKAQEQLFGYCLLNDWSARDIQRWESLPLGPFLGKSFCTVISPWVVTAQALAPFAVAPQPRPAGMPEPLPHLREDDGAMSTYAISVQSFISSAGMRAKAIAPVCITHSRFAAMHWTYSQMVAHHTSNGCDLRPGDLLGSGTISGTGDAARACLAEFAEPLQLPDGATRRWLADGDEIVLAARAERDGYVGIGFGECRSRVAPAR